MANVNTSIEWTDATWGPVTGCTKVSAGCKNCYAERVFPRAYGKVRKFTDVLTHPDRLEQPLHWKKPRRIFVNSMSDLFHEDVRDTFIADVFGVMARSPWHTYQILTKRPARMLDWMGTGAGWMTAALNFQDRELGGFAYPWPLPNVWLGVSCEDQKTADERIPLLLQTPAAIRFVSAEPLLSRVTLLAFLYKNLRATGDFRGQQERRQMKFTHDGLLGRLHWVICGGESGPKARPLEAQWIRSIAAQCISAGVPLFIKQMGSYVVDRNDAGFEAEWNGGRGWPAGVDQVEHLDEGYQGAPVRIRLKDKKGGSMEEWPKDLRVREFPQVLM